MLVGLFHDAQSHGRLAIDAHQFPVVFRADFSQADILQANGISVPIGQNQLIELGGLLQAAAHPDTKLTLGTLDAAGGDRHILSREGIFDILHGQESGCEPVRMQPDPHRIPSCPVDLDVRNTRQGGEPVFDVTFGEIGDLQFGMPVADQGQPDDAVRVAVRFHDLRRFDFARKQPQHPGHSIPDVIGRRIQITRQGELNVEGRQTFPAVGAQRAEPLDAAQRILEDRRNIGFHQLGIGALVHGQYRDDRKGDVRIFADGQTRITEDAEQHQQEGHDRRQDGTLNSRWVLSMRPVGMDTF